MRVWVRRYIHCWWNTPMYKYVILMANSAQPPTMCANGEDKKFEISSWRRYRDFERILVRGWYINTEESWCRADRENKSLPPAINSGNIGMSLPWILIYAISRLNSLFLKFSDYISIIYLPCARVCIQILH